MEKKSGETRLRAIRGRGQRERKARRREAVAKGRGEGGRRGGEGEAESKREGRGRGRQGQREGIGEGTARTSAGGHRCTITAYLYAYSSMPLRNCFEFHTVPMTYSFQTPPAQLSS